MANSTQAAAGRAITVPFHGADLYVVEHNGQPFTPMKPIVDGMGIDWKSQHAKLAANRARWGMVEITIPTAGGIQAMSCIALRKLFGWMAGIQIGKIKKEVRPAVLMYQNECDDVLWQYWTEGLAINPRAAYSVGPDDVLTQQEADTLRHAVEGWAKKLTSDTHVQGKFIMQAWSKLKAHFKVSYRQIPRHELAEAVSIVNRHAVEWELVDEAPRAGTVQEIVAGWVEKIEAPNGYPASLFQPVVDAVQRKQGKRAGSDGADQIEGAMLELLLEQRMLVSFDQVTRRMVSCLVPGDASVVSLGKDDFEGLVQRVPMARLPELADALNKRMSCHLAAFAEKLKAGRPERKPEPEPEQITVATVAGAIKQARSQGVTSIEGLARELGVHGSTAKKLVGTLTMRGALA